MRSRSASPRSSRPTANNEHSFARPTTVYLTPAQHLERIALALRGVRPSVADLKAVDADPSQLPAIVDRYLASPELGATIKDYLERGGAPEGLAEVTARLCHEAQERGLSVDETLAEIRATLGELLAACPLTSTDRAALVALAIDECVHAFYRERAE